MPWGDFNFISRPHVKVEPPTTYETKALLDSIDDLLAIQCSPGTWNVNPYMHGLANGMHLIRSIISGEEPDFLSAPDRWLDEQYNRLSGGERGVFGSAFVSCVEEARNKLTKKLKEDYPHEDYYLISEELPLDELIPTVMLRYGPQDKKGFSMDDDVISVYWDDEASSWVAQLEGDVPHPFPADPYDNEELVKESALAAMKVRRPNRVTDITRALITGRPPKMPVTSQRKGNKIMGRKRRTTVGKLHKERRADRVAPLEFEVGAVCLFDFLRMEPTQFGVTKNFPIDMLHVAGKWIANTDYGNDPTGDIQKTIPRLNDLEAAELYTMCSSRSEYVVRESKVRTAALKPADKRVVNDFVEGVPNDGGRVGTLWTDGEKLESMGLGGTVIAVKKGDNIYAIDGYSSRREESIVRYLKKITPRRRFYQELPYGYPVVKDTIRTSSLRRRRKAAFDPSQIEVTEDEYGTLYILPGVNLTGNIEKDVATMMQDEELESWLYGELGSDESITDVKGDVVYGGSDVQDFIRSYFPHRPSIARSSKRRRKSDLTYKPSRSYLDAREDASLHIMTIMKNLVKEGVNSGDIENPGPNFIFELTDKIWELVNSVDVYKRGL